MPDPPEDISPGKFNLLKFAPVTSCDVDRSFSAYKRISSDWRLSVTAEKNGEVPRGSLCIKIST
jgi:hypothetical protein